MNVFSRDDLQALLDQQQGPALSIFMPMEQAWPDVQQNPIRLKNLLHHTEEQLAERGLDPAACDAYLQPAYRLLGGTSTV